MSTDVTTTPTEPNAPYTGGSWWTGRSGLVFPLILAGFATYLLVGELTMDVAPDTDPPGPGFFPAAIIALLYLFALLQTIALVRKPEPPGDLHGDLRTTEISIVGQPRVRFYSDWSRVAWAVGGFAAFILLLEPLGWILAAGLLFWTMTQAFSAPKPLHNALVALTFSSVLYLIFAGLLSVNLPVGSIFAGGF
ncbi:MAG: Tricarboxylate transport protein TctB [Glaciihabitans sp.]|nr:Tricarboxylate transport protein TctB [Glaciihabitans sp.]